MEKSALVTGGSRGIGFAITQQLGRDGYSVAIFDRNAQEAYKENLDKLTAERIRWIYVQGDLTVAADRQRCVDTVIKEYGRIDVLVNDAGVAPRERNDLLGMTEESFDFVVGVNTKGTMFMTQAVAKQMVKQEMNGRKRGTIVNVSSCSAVVSSTNRGEYCISKAGVSMLTTLYADRLAPEGIFVYEVRPGVIATDMTSTVQDKYNKMIEDGAFPIKRWGYPEDIAGAVSAFCTDKFLYTTGNYVDIDGGFHIQRM